MVKVPSWLCRSSAPCASSARGWRLRAARDPGTQGSRPGPATASGARARRLPKSPIPPFLTLQVQSRAEEIYGGWYKHGTRTALPQTIAAAAILSASREMAAALRETMGVELTMANLTRVAGVAEGIILCRRHGGSDFGQLARRRRFSMPGHALDCPNPASHGRSAAWAALAGHVGRVFDLTLTLTLTLILTLLRYHHEDAQGGPSPLLVPLRTRSDGREQRHRQVSNQYEIRALTGTNA